MDVASMLKTIRLRVWIESAWLQYFAFTLAVFATSSPVMTVWINGGSPRHERSSGTRNMRYERRVALDSYIHYSTRVTTAGYIDTVVTETADEYY